MDTIPPLIMKIVGIHRELEIRPAIEDPYSHYLHHCIFAALDTRQLICEKLLVQVPMAPIGICITINLLDHLCLQLFIIIHRIILVVVLTHLKCLWQVIPATALTKA